MNDGGLVCGTERSNGDSDLTGVLFRGYGRLGRFEMVLPSKRKTPLAFSKL